MHLWLSWRLIKPTPSSLTVIHVCPPEVWLITYVCPTWSDWLYMYPKSDLLYMRVLPAVWFIIHVCPTSLLPDDWLTIYVYHTCHMITIHLHPAWSMIIHTTHCSVTNLHLHLVCNVITHASLSSLYLCSFRDLFNYTPFSSIGCN